jgi:hypothetical protein
VEVRQRHAVKRAAGSPASPRISPGITFHSDSRLSNDILLTTYIIRRVMINNLLMMNDFERSGRGVLDGTFYLPGDTKELIPQGAEPFLRGHQSLNYSRNF